MAETLQCPAYCASPGWIEAMSRGENAFIESTIIEVLLTMSVTDYQTVTREHRRPC
jgi:hypothetical protein